MSLRVGTFLPGFEGATLWLNAPGPPEDWQGSPLLVQFWAISCPVCKINIPTLQAWKTLYGPQNLRFVAVHMPRGQEDTDIALVERAVAEMGVSEPCAIDNAHAIGNRFETGGVWPCYFLFDASGKLKRHAAGVVGLKLLESALQSLLPPASPASQE